MFYTRNTPNMDNNQIWDFYNEKHADVEHDEIFYLSGIGYIYKCLDAVVANAGFDKLCINENGLCKECCKRQEAHVSLAEMRYFMVQNDNFEKHLSYAMNHAKLDYNNCSDLFFMNDICTVYENRFLVCRAYANLFNGEYYCPRHDGEILRGESIDDIIDCFYYFIDMLSELDERKYYGYITPTYFFIREHLLQIQEEAPIFFKQNELDLSWAKTYIKQKYSIGLLGTVEYNEEYMESVEQIDGDLSKMEGEKNG